MTGLFTIAGETYTILRRDKIFIPAVVMGVLSLILAHLASLWGIEEYHKILYDIGTLGFHVSGASVAVLWGTKVVADSRQQGSIEVALASPVSRSAWLLGRYLGLFFALLSFGMILMAFWQGLLFWQKISLFEYRSIMIMAVLMLGWFALAAVAVFLGAVMSQALALFACLALWVMGLISRPIANVLAPETGALTRELVKGIARFWDLGRFNLGQFASGPFFPGTLELAWIFAYGFFLVGTLLTLGCMVFSNKDLVS